MNIKNWTSISPFTLRSLGPMTLVSAAINALMLVVPIYSLQLFDRVLSSQSLETLWLLTVIAVFLLITQAVLDSLRQKYTQKRALRFEAECTQELYAKGSQGRQSVSQYLFNDINEIRSLLMSPGYFVVFDLPWTPLFIAVMFMLHPLIGLVGLIAVLVILIIAIISYIAKKGNFENAYMTQIATHRKLDELLNKQATVAAQRSGVGLMNTFQTVLAEKLWFRSKIDATAISITSFTKLIRMLLQLTIMGVGAALVINNAMSAGGMIAGSILMARALQPIEQLAAGLQGWKTGLTASARLQQELLQTNQVTERTELPNVNGELLVENATWYANETDAEPILNTIKMRLNPGNRVAIIGASGSGKTSLCQLIMGLNSPQKGRVCIDGLNVQHWSDKQFKQVVGYVPQNIQFLHGSIKDNIRHFDAEVTDSQVVKAALIAGVHDAILKMPNSYETLIGDGGFTLSGGQAQKLALARALCFKPKLLVLDEPNSHLDKEGEEHLTNILSQCREQNIAVVMITHQTHLLRHVDWVVELANGQIAKVGEASKVLRSMMDVHGSSKKGASHVKVND